MKTIQQLIHNPDTTLEDIFRASDNVGEIMDAAAVVHSGLSQAAAAVDAAIDAAQEHIERYIESNKPLTGQVLVGEAAIEVREKMEQAWQALSEALDARQRYRPWKIALDRLMQPQAIIEIN